MDLAKLCELQKQVSEQLGKISEREILVSQSLQKICDIQTEILKLIAEENDRKLHAVKNFAATT